MDTELNSRFKITTKIGSGAFGEIFHGFDHKTEEEVAIKLEKVNSKQPQLLYESKIYEHFLQGNTEIDKGIPHMYHCSKDDDNILMAMELLGPNLESLFNLCGRKLSLKTVLMLADQMLQRIEFLHSKTFLHRDIKPENFLMGIAKNQNVLYIIDFGLAKRYIYKDGKHIPNKDKRSFVGTARYASINTHLGIEQGRRDDLESLFYVLIYFLKGSLPWQNLQAPTKKDRYAKIMEKKINTPINILCQGIPVEFETILAYIRNLKHEDNPDYLYIKSTLKDLFNNMSLVNDYEFDWKSIRQNIDQS